MKTCSNWALAHFEHLLNLDTYIFWTYAQFEHLSIWKLIPPYHSNDLKSQFENDPKVQTSSINVYYDIVGSAWGEGVIFDQKVQTSSISVYYDIVGRAWGEGVIFDQKFRIQKRLTGNFFPLWVHIAIFLHSWVQKNGYVHSVFKFFNCECT